MKKNNYADTVEDIILELSNEFSNDGVLVVWDDVQRKIRLKEGTFHIEIFFNRIDIDFEIPQKNSIELDFPLVSFEKRKEKWTPLICWGTASRAHPHEKEYLAVKHLIPRFERAILKSLRPVSVNSILELDSDIK